MLPPEIAMTWYVPASCRRRVVSGSSPARSPISTAVTMPAERVLWAPTERAIQPRTLARTAAAHSARRAAGSSTSTSRALFTEPSRPMPRVRRRWAWSGVPKLA